MSGNSALLSRTCFASTLLAAFLAGCGGGDSSISSATKPDVTVAPAWTVPYLLEQEAGKAEYPSIALSTGGDAITIFAQQIEGRSAVHAVHGDLASTRFGKPRVIDNPGTSAQPPLLLTGKTQTATQVAMNTASGDAIATWSATTSGVPHVWAARYDKAGDKWSAPVQLDAAAGGASYPSIAMNMQGRAVVAWSEKLSGEVTQGVSVIHYNGSAWGAPVRLSTLTPADTPQVGIDAAGNAFVAWAEKNLAGITGIQVARIGGAGSGTPERAAFATTTPASQPSLAVAPNGNALLAWSQADGVSNSIYASVFRGSAWSVPQKIENLPGKNVAPSAALNNASGFVAWEQDENFTSRLYTARLNASNIWEDPVRVFHQGAYMPIVRMQDNGDAMLIWLAAHTQYARYSAAGGSWSGTTNLSPYNCGNGHALALDASSGRAYAAWIPATCARSADVYGAFFK